MDMVGTSVSEQVVQTVATRSNTDALDLPPLFDSVDPDALDALIREMTGGKVSFDYAGYNLTIDTDGVVEVDEHPTSGHTAKEAADDV